jgi:hypothetical protein
MRSMFAARPGILDGHFVADPRAPDRKENT